MQRLLGNEGEVQYRCIVAQNSGGGRCVLGGIVGLKAEKGGGEGLRVGHGFGESGRQLRARQPQMADGLDVDGDGGRDDGDGEQNRG